MTQLTPRAIAKRKQAPVLWKTRDQVRFLVFFGLVVYSSAHKWRACINSDLGQGRRVFVSAADVDDFLRPQEFNVTRDGAVLGKQQQTGSLDKFNPDLNPQQVKTQENKEHLYKFGPAISLAPRYFCS